MRVLTIYAHHNQRSFCHAVLERFCAGLKAAGHSNEVIDLHAIGFDPVFRDRDGPNWIDDSVPDDVLANMNVEKSLMDAARNPLRRWLTRRWIGGRDARGIIRKIRTTGGPRRRRRSAAEGSPSRGTGLHLPGLLRGFPRHLEDCRGALGGSSRRFVPPPPTPFRAEPACRGNHVATEFQGPVTFRRIP